jgi:hypothetical protein
MTFTFRGTGRFTRARLYGYARLIRTSYRPVYFESISTKLKYVVFRT